MTQVKIEMSAINIAERLQKIVKDVLVYKYMWGSRKIYRKVKKMREN